MLGKAAMLDLQIAAGLLHGDPARGLEHARRCADVARRLRADRLHATAVCFQAIAHVELGDREQAERCTAQALALAPDDLDINAAVWGQVRAHEALLADDLARLLETLDKAEDYLRRSPSTAADADPRPLGAGPHAVRPGRRRGQGRGPPVVGELGERVPASGTPRRSPAAAGAGSREADRELAEADRAMAALPWWQHRTRLLVADAALTDHWGDPIGWAREALPVFAGRGETRLASRCREVLRRAGAPGAPAGPRRHPGAAGAARGRRDQPRGGRAAADGRGADQHRDRPATGALAPDDRDARSEPGREDRRAQPGRAGRVGPGAD